MAHWLHRRGQQLLLANVKNADRQDSIFCLVRLFDIVNSNNVSKFLGSFNVKQKYTSPANLVRNFCMQKLMAHPCANKG